MPMSSPWKVSKPICGRRVRIARVSRAGLRGKSVCSRESKRAMNDRPRKSPCRPSGSSSQAKRVTCESVPSATWRTVRGTSPLVGSRGSAWSWDW